MKRKLFVIFTIFSLFSAQNTIGGVINLELEVIDSSGNWNVLTPMFLNTTETENPVSATINATNINVTEPLDYLQYFKWIFHYHDYTDAEELGNYKVQFYLEMNFTSNTMFNCSYMWLLHKDVTLTYTGTLKAYYNNKLLLSETEYGYDDTYKLEFHLWRSKSNQLAVFWRLNDNQGLKLGDTNSNWNLNNITYMFYTVVATPMDFCVTFDDLSVQSGNNEGIKDPVTDENWGIFEPIRQILLFILRLFMGLIELILPESIENVFDHFIESIGNYVTPFMAVMVWLGSNFIDFLIIINVFLLMNGVWKASEGELIEVVTPFWTFYSTLAGLVFRVIGFILDVIKAIIGALPF